MDTQLDAIYRHEKDKASRVWLTQPVGGGRVVDLTFAEAIGQARRIAAFLAAKGYPKGSRISIFSKNTAHWFLADLAIWMAGHVTVPIYPTLAASSIRQILEHSEVRLIFTGKLDGFAAMEPGIPENIERVRMPLAPPLAKGEAWEEIVRATEPMRGDPRRDPDEMATIVYTSGSTGTPKGAVHSFRSMCAGRVWIDHARMTVDDRALSYLPLAHVAERGVLETPNFFVGFHVFFAESLETFVTDLRRARPTFFGSVPRLWLKFQSGVFEKMPEKRLSLLLKVPVVRRLVARKILRGLGLDAVRAAFCGSAPVPEALLGWYASLGIEIAEIYGMTENWAVSHAGRLGEFSPGWIGGKLAGVEDRITHEGELLVKSPGNMVGYYLEPALTAEVLDAEGFVHTGDRGELDARGRLRITGRVKELFKTSKGKYVAPSPIENDLLAHPLIEQACVSGSGMPQPFALVVLSPSARASLAGDKAHADAVRAEVKALRAEINAARDPHEQLDRIVVVSDEWTIENGLLTPTMKLKRSAIEAKYAPQVEGWYAEREHILFA